MQGMSGPFGPNGQYMSRGPFPQGGGYPMGHPSHPHNMGGGPGPGFSGMPPGMRHSGGGPIPPGNMPITSLNQNFPQGGGGHVPMSSMSPGIRPSGPPGPFPPSGAMHCGPGGLFPGRGGAVVKTEVPSVSPRGANMSSFQHSPVPGNPTPPLTPNGPGCISAPFASPSSDAGSGSSGSGGNDVKPNFSLASK